MPKIVVTHHRPDLDAVMSCWILLRFDAPKYGDAKLVFVDAGKTYKNLPPDDDSNVTHVDVGMGMYDHHQEGRYGTCASRLVWEMLVEEVVVSPLNEELLAMVNHANAIDTFEDCYWQEASDTRFAFALSEVIPALHRLQIHDDEAVVRMCMVYLDGVYQRLKDRSKAIAAIEEGVKFDCIWGKAIVLITGADDASKQAQKMGYDLVVISEPSNRYTAIKTSPKVAYPLRPLYDKIASIENSDKWYYHNSDHMLFNGSRKGGVFVPTDLTLQELIDLIKNQK